MLTSRIRSWRLVVIILLIFIGMASCELYHIASSSKHYAEQADINTTSDIELRLLAGEYERKRSELINRHCNWFSNDYRKRFHDICNFERTQYNSLMSWRKSKADSASELTRLHELGKWVDGWVATIGNNFCADFYGQYDAHVSIYRMANARLLMSEAESEIWRRIENATGTLAVGSVNFSCGSTKAKLPWRLFEADPSKKVYEWWVFIDPRTMFSYGGRDYAVAWFAGADNMSHDPTTTEEQVLMEIEDGEIKRYVGLHNIQFCNGCGDDYNDVSSIATLRGDWVVSSAFVMSVNKEHGVVILIAVTGYSEKTSFCIDLCRMKIIGDKSVLSTEFSRDGYADRFVAGTVARGE